MIKVILFGLVLLIGIMAAILGRSKKTSLDLETLVKVAQSVLLWGKHDNPENWLKELSKSIYYSTCGREAIKKLLEPNVYQIPVPALPGERALMEDLSKLPVDKRFERLFSDDYCMQPILDDPNLLGDVYNPSTWLGHDTTWEKVSKWDDTVISHLSRKLSYLRMLIITDDLHEKKAKLILDIFVQIFPGRIVKSIEKEQFTSPEERLLILIYGSELSPVVKWLASDARLRDRISALFLVNTHCVLDTEAQKSFNQEALDTELARTTPWFVLPVVTAKNWNESWTKQTVEEPPLPESLRHPVEIRDLGPMPEDLDPQILAKSLLLLCCLL